MSNNYVNSIYWCGIVASGTFEDAKHKSMSHQPVLKEHTTKKGRIVFSTDNEEERARGRDLNQSQEALEITKKKKKNHMLICKKDVENSKIALHCRTQNLA